MNQGVKRDDREARARVHVSFLFVSLSLSPPPFSLSLSLFSPTARISLRGELWARALYERARSVTSACLGAFHASRESETSGT